MEQATSSQDKKQRVMRGGDGGGFVWFLGAIGAAVYYIQSADSFLQGAFGILKALVWPAMLVYYFLQSLGA
ncbi:hypothetical protein C4568_01710 [Candidatus Parcubacteria bacterium]|nr:MAG: hypothetical protein C4568_01710 [Candidatus Parcubacteria bacterium]